MKLNKQLLKKIAVSATAFLIIFGITGFFILPPIVKSVLVKKLSEGLNREVLVDAVKINPFTLSVTLRNLSISERNKTDRFISVGELFINFSLASIIKKGVIVKEINIASPYMHIERGEDLLYNFSDLLESGPAEPGTSPLRFSLNNVVISSGKVDFMDRPKKTSHTVTDLSVSVPFISNFSYYVDSYVTPSFDAMVNGRAVSLKGMTKPFKDSLETSFEINLKEVDIPYYLAYSPFKMDYRFQSGLLDAKTIFTFIQYKDRQPVINLSGGIVFSRVRIEDLKGSPMASLPSLALSIGSSDLVSRRIHFNSIVLRAPEFTVEREKSGRFNLERLVPKNDPGREDVGKSVRPDDGSPPVVINAEEIKIADGRVIFTDESVKGGFKTAIDEIELLVGHFSTEKDKKTSMTLSFKTNAGENLSLTTEFSVDPLASEGRIGISGIPLRKYAPYYSDGLLFSLQSGLLEITSSFKYSDARPEPQITLTDLSVGLKGLRLRKDDEDFDFLSVPVFALKDTMVDINGREVVAGKIYSENGELRVKRSAEGQFNLVNLLLPPASGGGTSGKPAVKPEKDWKWTAKSISADRYKADFEDLLPSGAVRLEAGSIRLSAENISNIKKSRGRVSISLKTGKYGELSASGTIGINPLNAALKTSINNIDISPVHSYLEDSLNIIIADGDASAKGEIAIRHDEKTGISAAYNGEASIKKLLTLDKENADDFVKWETLHIGGINAGYNPSFISAGEVALSDFYTRLIINPDGSLNLQDIVVRKGPPSDYPKPSASEAPVHKESSSRMPVKIDKVTVQAGTINFSDRFVKPGYSANLLEIGGRITGLSSEENVMADVDLRGMLDRYAPLEIKGKINPLREDLYVDLKADFRDMDLSPLTPYSGKYLGYTIQKGKLSLDLRYLIVKKKLDAENSIFLDQFAFGDGIESPDAVKLPVKLAVSLLKNRKGEITLDVPVTGYIDDPKFSVGRIVIKILLNLLVKAATSPFALLGAVMGGGEELSFVDFDAGSTSLGEQELKKLGTLTAALYDRPGLKLEIEGHVDVEKDREGLRRLIYDRKLKSQKLREMIKKGQEAMPVDEIKIDASEYPVYLKMAYKEEKFPKPRNILGIAKDLPVPEMEKLILTHIVLGEDDLKRLASERALSVRDRIVQSGKVEAERVFLVEPKTLAPEKKENMRDSRVDFRLK